jgi:hypothetical protein
VDNELAQNEMLQALAQNADALLAKGFRGSFHRIIARRCGAERALERPRQTVASGKAACRRAIRCVVTDEQWWGLASSRTDARARRDIAGRRESMARETRYFVQGFTESRGALVAVAPTQCKDEGAARRAVIHLGATLAGAVAFASSGDAELGDFDDEPVILSVVGLVPESFHE